MSSNESTRKGRTQGARQILKRGATIAAKNLVAHVSKELDMTATEVQAARIILGKVVPDLKAIDYSISAAQKSPEELSLDELTVRIAQIRASLAGGNGAAEESEAKLH